MLRRALPVVIEEARACRVCADALPLGPRPVLRATTSARILLVGQAPGTRVHATGIDWNDASGARLRGWLGVDAGVFYGPLVAAVPMGFCYPGRGKSGDLPPRPECAPLWHPQILPLLTKVRLTLVIGAYAQARVLGPHAGPNVTETVRAWRQHLPLRFPLPHPSPRNTLWQKKNPWFGKQCIPALRRAVADALA